LKKSLASPGIPIPRKKFAKPNILSPGSWKCKGKTSTENSNRIKKYNIVPDTPHTFIFPEVTAANAVTPRTTEEVVEREP